MNKIKKIGVLALAAVCAFSAAFAAAYRTSVNTSAADSLVKQDINYTELVGRVNQSDSGFTIGSTAVDSKEMSASTQPFTGNNAKGFQFYYLDLRNWSSGNGGTDSPIADWYLTWLDNTLANLRANGGSCIIRACYSINGNTNPEPNSLDVITQHQQQLSSVLSNYHDVIVAVECGMLGPWGEMHSGKYSEHKNAKKLVLENWLSNLPDDVTVSVRTLDEYLFYVNNSDVYQTKYKGKTVNGITYPDEIERGTCDIYPFSGEVFNRIGFYNDAMIQDYNDGGTFYCSRGRFARFLNQKSDRIAYGGEFSGTDGYVRFEDATWLPLNAITEFYKNHVGYYHGGNAAYESTGKYKTGQTFSKTYSSADEATKMANQFNAWLTDVGSGMSGTATASGTKVSYSAGGWQSATVGDALINKLQTDANVTADLSAYSGKPVSTFFEDHLGYKLVLKDSYLPEKVKKGGQLTVKGTVDNTGFTNINRSKVCEIVLSDNASGDNMYILKIDDLDVSSWTGGSRNSYEMTLGLPEDIKPGDYQVYLRIASPDADGNTNKASCIRFANPGQFTNSVQGSSYSVGAGTVNIIYDPDICGNYLGTFTVY